MRSITTASACCALALALAACNGVAEPRYEAKSELVRARAGELVALARRGWSLPLRVRAFFSNAADGQALPREQEAREERLVLAQLEELDRFYSVSAFDVFAVQVRVAEGAEKEVRVDPEGPALAVVLPRPEAGGRSAPASAEELLDAVARRYRWDKVGRWYLGERSEDLVAALRRDLGKLVELDRALRLEQRRLENLAAEVDARSQAEGRAQRFTPSETGYARAAQCAIVHALNRLLNTLARWRLAAEEPALSLRAEARLVLAYGGALLEGHLGWYLDTVVGGRTTTRPWERSFWNRNALYELLDGAAPAVPLAPGQAPGRLAGGSVRSLLSLRLDGDLRAALEAFDQYAGAPRQPLDPRLEAAAAPVLALLPEARRRARERSLSSFRAWKELWDARLKDGAALPFYEVVAGVGRVLGATRTKHPEPKVSRGSLAALEALLRPGDILLVRQEHYLSNAFLPGFWTHAMLYLGPAEGLARLRLKGGTPLGEDPVVREALARYARPVEGGPARIIEAVSRGVIFSSLDHAARKDFVAALRPDLDEAALAAGLRRALSFHGRPYDFDFDFASDDKLVCTELVYRAFDERLNFRVAADAPQDEGAQRVPGVERIMGRETMPANALARYALHMADHPRPDAARRYPGQRLALVAVLDSQDRAGAVLLRGALGLGALRASVDR